MKRLTLKQRKAKKANMIAMMLIGSCSVFFLTIVIGCLYAHADLVKYL